MTIDNNDMKLIFDALSKVLSGECNRLKAFNSIKDNVNIKQNNFYNLCEKISVLVRLQQLGVEDFIIDDIASKMKMFYIWRVYNSNE